MLHENQMQKVVNLSGGSLYPTVFDRHMSSAMQDPSFDLRAVAF